ncbi:MAG: LysM peptidoglycan-binding domain-containing protein [Pseudohongiellaceae bacterium]
MLGTVSLLLLLAACQTGLQPSQPDTAAEPVAPELSPPAPTSQTSLPAPTPDSNQPPGFDDVWQRLRHGLQLQEYYQHPEVEQRVAAFTGDQRLFDLVTERAAPFLHFIVSAVEQRGLPMELALLPIVESSFDPNAYSAQHAVGLWQFLGPTGRSFGLQLDWWYDGRRDPHAATIAALEYLSRLHQQFDGDWLLALAAYNTGSPNLRRAIRRATRGGESPDFWTLPLAPETLAHVPKLLALGRLLADPEQYQIELAPIPNQPALVAVDVGAQIDLREAARLAGINYAELRRSIPAFSNGQPIRTHHRRCICRRRCHSLSQRWRRSQGTVRTWTSTDPTGHLFNPALTEVEVLRVINGLSGNRIIAGRNLLVPRGLNANSDLEQLAAVAAQHNEPPPSIPNQYTVRRGDNLWRIARRFQLRSADIMAHNGITADALLMPGQVLDLRFAATASGALPASVTASSTEYRVRPGDTMADIAANLNLALAELLRWNGFQGNEVIYPDQLIRISPPDPELQSL